VVWAPALCHQGAPRQLFFKVFLPPHQIVQPWLLAGGDGAPGPSVGGLSCCGRSPPELHWTLLRLVLGDGKTNGVDKCDWEGVAVIEGVGEASTCACGQQQECGRHG